MFYYIDCRHLTLQVIAEAILSLPPEESDSTFAHMYLPIVTEGNLRTWSPQRMLIPSPAMFKFEKDVMKLNDYVTSLIVNRWNLRLEESKQQGALERETDVLDKILGAVEPSEWGTSTIKQIRDEIKTFILAGHETSASMLAWSLYELSLENNQHYREKVLENARNAYSSSSIDIDRIIENIPSNQKLNNDLLHTERCLKESLRKYSVVPTVVRVASEDVKLKEHFIPKGTSIMVCMQGVHHNEKYWPNPLEYNPSRFEKPAAPYTFLPFVEGPRMCLGQFLSLLESKIVLSCLISKYKFTVVNHDDAGLKHPFMVPITPKTGHYMRVE